jgi:hypothetical protein
VYQSAATRHSTNTKDLECRQNHVHPDRIIQIAFHRELCATPRDCTEDQRANQILDQAEEFIKSSEQA